MLEAKGVGVAIGRHRLLEDVSLAVPPGLVTCVLGPNGAGKSTVLRVLAGALAPSAGTVSLAGRPLAAWPADALARLRAVLPQSSALSFAFTVAEVVLLGRTPHAGRCTRAEDRAIVAAAMAAADVSALAARRYPSLSGGEQQRVQLARVLAQVMDQAGRYEGRWLLLDEPTASLDLAHQQQLLACARGVAAAGGGVLAILHDLNLAAAIADRVCLLRQGRVVAQGPPTDVLTAARIAEVFGIEALVMPHPRAAQPLIVPLGGAGPG
jgi:iron complex transport system ATP-binding protein